jgi:hypothetical protein
MAKQHPIVTTAKILAGVLKLVSMWMKSKNSADYTPPQDAPPAPTHHHRHQ